MTARLADYRLERGVYRLGQFAPVSIRDQIVRANFVVDGLWDAGYLHPASRLVVIGAGAAGIAAGLAAQRVGVRSIAVLERSDQYMPLQANVSSRWLDPVQYDWPTSYWADQLWPLNEGAVRRYTAKRAPFPTLPALEADLWATWFEAQAVGARLQVSRKRDVFRWARVLTGGFQVDAKDTDTGRTMRWGADIIIVATGFGWEVASVPSTGGGNPFVGVDFWHLDKFETASRGLPSPGAILISGTGDGALQDFIRLVTGEPSARSVLTKILNATPEMSPWKAALTELGHWDQHAEVSLASVTKAFSSCELYLRLHEKFEEAIRKLEAHSDWTTVRAVLDQLLLRKPPPPIRLLLKCTHFAKCYPLNRLVALLLLRYLASTTLNIGAVHRVALSSTEAIGHDCQPGCWGEMHRVTLVPGTGCETTGDDIKKLTALGKTTEGGDYLGLVIRHGIKPLASPHFPTVALSTYAVPCHLP